MNNPTDMPVATVPTPTAVSPVATTEAPMKLLNRKRKRRTTTHLMTTRLRVCLGRRQQTVYNTKTNAFVTVKRSARLAQQQSH